MDKMTQDKAKKWDGKSRISNDTYRQRWNEIFDPNGLPKNYTDKYTDSLDKDDEEYLNSLKEKI